MTQRILITGASGFIGKQVLKSLQNQKSKIILLVWPGWKEKIQCYEGIT